MWYKLHKFMRVSPPWVRRFFWRQWYDLLSKYRFGGTTFLNYGYAFTEADGHPLTLDTRDEMNRYPIQIYHHVTAKVDLNGCDVLEVASGRGGGAAYIMKYLKPRSLVGIAPQPMPLPSPTGHTVWLDLNSAGATPSGLMQPSVLRRPTVLGRWTPFSVRHAGYCAEGDTSSIAIYGHGNRLQIFEKHSAGQDWR